MTAEYSSIDLVKGLTQISSITSSTSPSTAQVTRFIERAQDRIDFSTHHAWRLRHSATNSGDDTTAKYEYHDVDFLYEWQSGRPVFLDHRKIRTFDADEGDVLEIWDGSAYESFIADSTEGRGEDFWIDYEQGVLYIKRRWSVKGPRKLRIKYRYGEETVNGIVEDIATKMVAIDIIMGDRRAVLMPEGGQNLSFQQMIDNWKEDIKEDLARVRELQVPSIHM